MAPIFDLPVRPTMPVIREAAFPAANAIDSSFATCTRPANARPIHGLASAKRDITTSPPDFSAGPCTDKLGNGF